jgi:two-component system sensor histidine kinase HydH
MKAVGTLAAGLAHEIRNPLASIKTFTDYLGTHFDDPAFRQKFQKIVGGEVERINLIVQQLLDFAKPVPPKLTLVDVGCLLDDTLELLSSELMKYRVEVERRYVFPAPKILGDPQQLRQVLLNLCLNSLQAMNGAGRLTVQTAVAGSELRITIADNGCGIAGRDLPRVFDPFFSTKPAGTGLGLAVVHSIISEHRGRVVVDSRVGEGTQVTIRFPLASNSI